MEEEERGEREGRNEGRAKEEGVTHSHGFMSPIY